MSTPENPTPYRAKELDDGATLEALDDFFANTGPTGEQALHWLAGHRDLLAEKLESRPTLSGPLNHYEQELVMVTLQDQSRILEACRQDLIGQHLVREYVDECRQTIPPDAGPRCEDYWEMRALAMARPEVQRLDRSTRKRVLQHEVWTECERIWTISQALAARGYDAYADTEQAHHEVDPQLLYDTLDGMSIEGMVQWSDALRSLRQQLLVANGANERLTAIKRTGEVISLSEDIEHMSTDELLALHDKKVRRVEAEISMFNAGVGAGSPSEKLYQHIRWMESLLDFTFDVKDAGAQVEETELAHYNDAAATLMADALLAIRSGCMTPYEYTLTRNFDAYVRRTARSQDPSSLARNHTMEYADLEAYVVKLWNFGEQLCRERERQATARTAGRLAYQHAG